MSYAALSNAPLVFQSTWLCELICIQSLLRSLSVIGRITLETVSNQICSRKHHFTKQSRLSPSTCDCTTLQGVFFADFRQQLIMHHGLSITYSVGGWGRGQNVYHMGGTAHLPLYWLWYAYLGQCHIICNVYSGFC